MVNDHQVALGSPVTVLLDRDATKAQVLAAEEFVATLTARPCSVHYPGRAAVVVITPAPSGPRKPQRRYAHGGHAGIKERNTT